MTNGIPSDTDGLEEFWADILSEEPDRIIAAWLTLAPDEQQSVLTHLRRMAAEEGWADVQRQSAMAAIYVIEEGE
ncbi:MAG: hypothetical protein U0528_15965 [Anaerolineae bacterium]